MSKILFGKTYEGYCQTMDQIKKLVLDLILSEEKARVFENN